MSWEAHGQLVKLYGYRFHLTTMATTAGCVIHDSHGRSSHHASATGQAAASVPRLLASLQRHLLAVWQAKDRRCIGYRLLRWQAAQCPEMRTTPALRIVAAAAVLVAACLLSLPSASDARSLAGRKYNDLEKSSKYETTEQLLDAYVDKDDLEYLDDEDEDDEPTEGGGKQAEEEFDEEGGGDHVDDGHDAPAEEDAGGRDEEEDGGQFEEGFFDEPRPVLSSKCTLDCKDWCKDLADSCDDAGSQCRKCFAVSGLFHVGSSMPGPYLCGEYFTGESRVTSIMECEDEEPMMCCCDVQQYGFLNKDGECIGT